MLYKLLFYTLINYNNYKILIYIFGKFELPLVKTLKYDILQPIVYANLLRLSLL